MPILTLVRLSILRNLSHTDLPSRIRARYLAARLSRRHGCNVYA